MVGCACHPELVSFRIRLGMGDGLHHEVNVTLVRGLCEHLSVVQGFSCKLRGKPNE